MTKMTKRNLASLALKLMAVYVLISFIPALPNLLLMLQMMVAANRIWISFATLSLAFLYPVLWIGFGLLLIKFADRIASWLVPEDEVFGTISVQDEDAIQKVILVSIGVLVAVRALPQLVSVTGSMVYLSQIDPAFSVVRENHLPVGNVLSFITQAALGCFLVFRPSQVLALIRRYQKEDRLQD